MRRKPYWVISALLIIVVLVVLVSVMGNNAPTTYIQEAASAPAATAAPTATNMPDTSTPVPTISDISAYQIVAPPAYNEIGTVPVYRAIECDLTGIVQPERLNQSGTVEKRSESSIVFTDHATLSYLWPALRKRHQCLFENDPYTFSNLHASASAMLCVSR